MLQFDRTPIDAAVSEAMDRMATMRPGDIIQVAVNGGTYSTWCVADSVRYHGRKLWGIGKCQVVRRGLKGEVAITRREDRV
jgi:hypothetical protein